MIEGLAQTKEVRLLSAAVRELLADQQPLATVAALADEEPGWSPKVWSSLADGLGLQGCAIPEVYGGVGFTQRELAAAFEQLGYGLLAGPMLGTVAMATNVLISCADEDVKLELLPALSAGELRAALVVPSDVDLDGGGRCGVELHPSSSSGVTVRGAVSPVVDAVEADVLIVAAAGSDGEVSLVVTSRGADGVSVEPLPSMDSTRGLAAVRFNDAPGRLIGALGEGWLPLQRGLDLGRVALANEQVGIAQRCLEMAVNYAKVRKQFGRPIGSFQAVKHICAGMLMEVESARSAAMYAATVAAGTTQAEVQQLPYRASVAQAACSDAAYSVAAACIQVHGGLGYTWGHDAHLFFKRAHSSRLLLGTPEQHRERVMATKDAL